ncbi:acetylglutamate kinase [Ammoniphilus sp. CFH 90114]|uniref:acetylglutamate kinase n=1 Tax=Ammoniphilus sp. CFH 90114 TaxID=2493665 RepID=UPI00100EAC88|nr:acetylglutamate kinase [Ammoniphilus sp. CFH 90114]RXT04001.1 acetylglutamate kinase [Ammoniphilus sp. CFH 90114]
MFVLKCGGSTLDNLQASFYEELIQLKRDGFDPVIVHGGGPAISNTLKSFNIEPQFIDGLRVTDEATLQVVEMVLIGQTNKQIVKNLQGYGFGLSGMDGQLIQASKMPGPLGFVGQIEQIKPEILKQISDMGYIPVVAPLGLDSEGQSYNINADTAAGAVASALEVSQLIVVTDVPGVMENGEVIPELTVEGVNELIASGVITGGMIPKVKAAMDALKAADQVVIIDPSNLSRAVQGESVGTKITGKVE